MLGSLVSRCAGCLSSAKALMLCGAMAIAGMFALPQAAHAGATPTVGPVVFPVDPEEIGDVISQAGANILVIVFTVSIGFALVYMVIRRLKKAI